jgi:hypothetical protein
MRRISFFLPLVMALITGVSTSYAQDKPGKVKDAMQEQGHSRLIKNPDAQEIWVEGYLIDKRAAKYYYPGQLDEVSLAKAEKINLIYVSSFELMSTGLSKDCLQWMRTEFDLGAYNQLRSFEKRVEVEVEHLHCRFKIALHSWSEINSMGTD